MADHLVLATSNSVVEGWLAATQALSTAKKPVYNLVYSTSSPADKQAGDDAVIRTFNAFAATHGFHSTETVANTIFPLDTYMAKRGSPHDEFYDYYLDVVLPRVRKRWGTYFERLTIRRNDNGTAMMNGNRRVNPLDLLIEKLKRRVEEGRGTKTHYEASMDDAPLDVATYDSRRDSAYRIGGPCLSHISLKLDGDDVLRLTAFYRSQWYIERALGNLVGLARLQWFVAQASGARVGPLTSSRRRRCWISEVSAALRTRPEPCLPNAGLWRLDPLERALSRSRRQGIRCCGRRARVLSV